MAKSLCSNQFRLRLIFLFACLLFGSQPRLSAAKDNQRVDAIPLLKKATESIKLKQYGEALTFLNSAIEADVGLSEAYCRQSSIFRQLCRHFQKGFRLDPEHSELKKACVGLKNLLKKTKSAEDNAAKGKLRAAVTDCGAALALDPNHSARDVHLYLGLCEVLVRLGRRKDAVNCCAEALDIDVELDEALVQRGEARRLIEGREGAVENQTATHKKPQL